MVLHNNDLICLIGLVSAAGDDVAMEMTLVLSQTNLLNHGQLSTRQNLRMATLT